jgi:hypothetical protein
MTTSLRHLWRAGQAHGSARTMAACAAIAITALMVAPPHASAASAAADPCRVTSTGAHPCSSAPPAPPALVAPAAHYYGVGVQANDESADSAYMDRAPARATTTDGGSTVQAQLSFGDPSTQTPFTLRYQVSSGATAALVEYGTVQRPDECCGPLDTAPILLYLAPSSSAPIGTPETLQLNSSLTADPNLPATGIDVLVNSVRYPVGTPAAIPLKTGSLVYLQVLAYYQTTPNHTSQLTLSLAIAG